MTCKDCIHHDLCFDNGTLFLNFAKGKQKENAETNCPFKKFKNKADFVEVVRCKDCTHKVDYCGRIMCDKNARRINDGIVGLTATSPEHFCSYGERKDVSKMEITTEEGVE